MASNFGQTLVCYGEPSGGQGEEISGIAFELLPSKDPAVSTLKLAMSKLKSSSYCRKGFYSCENSKVKTYPMLAENMILTSPWLNYF